MPNDGPVGQIQAELDRRRAGLQAIMADPAQADHHLDVLRAVNELNKLEGKLADMRIRDRSQAFRAVSEALDAAAARMTGNRFLDVLEQIRQTARTLGLAGDDGNAGPADAGGEAGET